MRYQSRQGDLYEVHRIDGRNDLAGLLCDDCCGSGVAGAAMKPQTTFANGKSPWANYLPPPRKVPLYPELAAVPVVQVTPSMAPTSKAILDYLITQDDPKTSMEIANAIKLTHKVVASRCKDFATSGRNIKSHRQSNLRDMYVAVFSYNFDSELNQGIVKRVKRVPAPRGGYRSTHVLPKFSPEQADEIRAKRDAGCKLRELAAMYSTDLSLLKRVIGRRGAYA